MTNQQPTQEQIKEFWEWCGFTWWTGNFKDEPGGWRFPDGKLHIGKLKPDLNNLFSWAVPKLHGGYKIWLTHFPEFDTYNAQIGDSSISLKDPALALFWAIWEVIHATN